jgi:hypothetical protein
MTRKAKMNPVDLAFALKAAGYKAQVFGTGIHWRIVGMNVDLWPTTGNWKFMGCMTNGTIEEFIAFLGKVTELKSEFSETLEFRE